MKYKMFLFGAIFAILWGCVDLTKPTPLSVEIINESEFGVHYVYCTPVHIRSWGRNLLVYQNIILPRTSANVSLPKMGQQSCNWDIKLVSLMRGVYTKFNVNLCRSNRVTLTENYRISTE